MADYYPLIARAVGGLSDRSPEMRNAVYTRARDALMGQLRSLDPPLPEATIQQERTALEAAIERVEQEQLPGAAAAPPASPPAPRPQPAPPLPRDPPRPREAAAPRAPEPAPRAEPDRSPAAPPVRPAPPPVRPEPAPPAAPRPRPEAPPPVPRDRPEPGTAPGGTRARPEPDPAPPAGERPRPEPEAPPRPAARPRVEREAPPPVPVRPRVEAEPAPSGFKLPVARDKARPAAPDRRPALATVEPDARPPAPVVGEPAAPGTDTAPEPLDPPDAETGDAFAAPDADQTLRPRIGTQAPVTVNPGRGRSLILGAVLVLVIGLIGLLAWTLRDRPDELPRPGTVAEAPAPEQGAKIGERVGGPAPPAAAPAAPAAPEARPAPRVEANANPMAVLYEEDRDNPQAPKTTGGRVTWRTDALNAGQGQPLDTAIRAMVEIPEAGFVLSLVVRRNLDATLPASHTIELNFTTRPGDPARVVRDVGVLQFRNDVNTRGTPVAGLPVPVRDNLFLIGLSNLPADVERNMELLRRRNWIDLPIRMASGQRAIVSFEKGTPGEAVVADAVRQWQQ